MKSKNWRQWITNATFTTCWRCENLDGKIYSTYDTDFEEPPLHLYCRCLTIALKATTAGNATKDGENSDDFWIKYYGKLLDYYLSSE